jgi:hypothetical protein
MAGFFDVGLKPIGGDRRKLPEQPAFQESESPPTKLRTSDFEVLGPAEEVSPEVPKSSIGNVALDAGKMAASGAVTGIGSGVRGVGESMIDPMKQLGAQASPSMSMGAALAQAIQGERIVAKPKPGTPNPLESPAAALEKTGKRIESTVSPETRQMVEQSKPRGDLTDPESWSFGDNPSVRGYLMQGLQIGGQMLPQIAAAVALRNASGAAQVAAGGAIGGAQGAGSAAIQARETIQAMDDSALFQESEQFRKSVLGGMSPEKARALVTRDAERWAAGLTAPVSVLGGGATGALFGRGGAAMASRLNSRLARGATIGAAGGIEEGTQEVGEGVATQAGINQGAGTNQSLTQDSFGNFVLGAMAGGATGAARGLASDGPKPQAPEPAAKPAVPPGLNEGVRGSPVANRESPIAAAWEIVDDPITGERRRSLRLAGPQENKLLEATPDNSLPGGGPSNNLAGAQAFPAIEPPEPRFTPDDISNDTARSGGFQIDPDGVLSSRFGGAPFMLRPTAERVAKMVGGQVIQVDGGFRVKRSSDAGSGSTIPGLGMERSVGADLQINPAAGNSNSTLSVSQPKSNVDQLATAGPIPNSQFVPEQAIGLEADAARVRPASSADAVTEAANQAATSPNNDLPEPTQAQKEAGNYKKGRVTIGGLNISIENPQGSTRSGVSQDGKTWKNTLRDHYGYVRRTLGADGDQVDVFIKPGAGTELSGSVFVIDQVDPKSRKFDEHKVMIGYRNEAEAKRAYLRNYDKGWGGLGNITAMAPDEFSAWLDRGNTKKPLGSDSDQKPTNADQQPDATAKKIQDLGEKIGGARKDTAALAGGARRATSKDERPAWARRFEVSQIVAGNDEGRWVLRDTRSKDRLGKAKQVGRDTYATEQDALDVVPLAAVSLKHRAFPTGAKDESGQYTYEIWREINDRKRVKVVDQVFASRSDAMEYMVKNAQAILETNTTFGEADLPTPDRTDRTGVSRRNDDVQASDFMDTFGFRGVEFGNWNNQIERQEVMNAAYDGLMDLAEVMGVAPKAIGLNGDLALAFGARGQGLNSARAHYELDRAVINLTKMNGAGALAHEWFHALDHYFGRQDGKASSQWKVGADGTKTFEVKGAEDAMASGGFRRVNSGVRQELRDAYTSIMETMFSKAEQYVEDTAKADQFVAKAREEVAKGLDNLRKELSEQKDVRYYKRNNKPASAEQLAEFDTVAKQIINGESLEIGRFQVEGSRSATGSRWSTEALEKLSAIYKAVRGRSGFGSGDQSGVMDDLRGDMTRYSQRLKMLAEAQAGNQKTKRVPTEFAMSAKELDQGRGENYWTTPHEMAARAFQGYVEDKIAAGGARSPFLNYGPENAAILTPWGGKRPYPYGKERQEINKAFDKFVEVLETRETERGVALFSRPKAKQSQPPNPQEQIRSALSFAGEVLLEIANNAGAFAFPISKSRSVQGVVEDIQPEFVYEGEVTAEDERNESGADEKHLIRNTMGKEAYIYLTKGEVWIDVSRFRPGQGGQAIYAMAGDLAKNTGRVFIGDPAGLTGDALRRRTEAMLSSALRHGTTAHLEPHENQTKGDTKSGVNPLKWTVGNDVKNIESLILATLDNLRATLPEIDDYEFDFNTGQFRSRNDKLPYEDEAFEIEANRTAGARTALAGSRTLKRAAFINSLLRAPSESRPQLLEYALRLNDPQLGFLRGLFSRRDLPKKQSDRQEAPNDATQESTETMAPGMRQLAAALGQEAARRRVSGRAIKGLKAVQVPDAANESIEALGERFGRKVVFVSGVDALPDELAFTGLFAGGDTLYISDKVDKPVQWVIGHEFLHSLRRSNPELYRELQDRLEPYVNSPEFAKHAKGRAADYGGNNMDLGVEETMADVFGDAWYRGAMWQSIGKTDPSFFKRLVAKWKAFAARVRAILAPYSEAKSVISDMNAAREVIADVLAKASGADQSQDAFGAQSNSATRFTPSASRRRAGVSEVVQDVSSMRFKAWFGDSKVVDQNGEPLVMYHGTAEDFSVFSSKRGRLIYFARDPETAEMFAYASAEGTDGDASILPVYLSVQNLFDPENSEHLAQITYSTARRELASGMFGDVERHQKWIAAAGFDGVLVKETPATDLADRDIAVFKPEQIKSAIGNRGTFNPNDPNILFSRPADRMKAVDQALDKARGGPLDRLLQGVGGRTLANLLTKPLYERVTRGAASLIPEKVKQGLVHDYGLPEPYVYMREATRFAGNTELRKSKNSIEILAGLDREQSRVAYQWMTEKPDRDLEASMMAALPEEEAAVVKQMKAMVDAMGRDAVSVGLLSEETYLRNRMAYLHRSYKKYEAQAGKAAAAKWKQGAAIRAENFKGRGLRDDFDADALVQYLPDDASIVQGTKFVRFEQRDRIGRLRDVQYVPVGVKPPARFDTWATDGVWEARWLGTGKTVGLWRDFTKSEREAMGEMEEVRYAFAKTMLQGIRDIENAKFLKWIAANYSRAPLDLQAEGIEVKEPSTGYIAIQAYRPDEWVRVPDTNVAGTKIKKFGALAGKAVPAPIWNDIRSQMASMPESDIAKAYDVILRAWKISKTALSPAVHTNNVMSNFVMADMAEVRFKNIAKSVRTLMAARKGDPQAKALIDRYEDSGAEEGSMVAREMFTDSIEPLLKELEDQRREELGTVSLSSIISMIAHKEFSQALEGIKTNKELRMAALPFKKLIEAYQKEDSVFRLAAFLMKLEEGKSDVEAGRYAKDAFLDYNINAPWIQTLRRGPFPFIAFSYRAIPKMIETAAKKPWKLAKYLGVASAVNALGYMMAGGNEDDERSLLPEEKRGKLLGVIPSLIRMPWNDSYGSPVFLDIRRWIPGGDMFDVSQSQAATPLPSWLSVGGPLALMVETSANKSLFTGKPIALATDTAGERFAKVTDHVFKFMAPNLPIPNPLGWVADDSLNVPGLWQTHSWTSIQNAGTGVTDAFGRERSLGQAALSSVGIKVGSYPADVALQNQMMKYREQEAEIKRQQRQISRQAGRGAISDGEAEEKLQYQNEKLQRLNDRLQKLRDGE